MEFQEFKCGKPGVEPKILGQEANLPPDFHIIGGRAKYEGLPAAGLHQSQQHFNRGTLSRAIWAQEAKHFAGAYRQGEIAYRNLVPKYFAQFQRLNGRVGRLIQVPLQELTGI
jgi:hypothetical protein